MRKIVLLIAFFSTCLIQAQSDDPVLFTIGEDKVTVSEFKYIYEKNNAGAADYSEKSVSEYLDLYKKFKLKVHKARQLGMDTISSLQRELEGYRKQLADSYLKDKEISDKLVDEVFQRSQEDRKVAHIFFSSAENAPPALQEKVEQRAKDVHSKLKTNKGAGFELMAKTLSDDKASAKNEGILGYYTAPLPDGFYEFESAMYETPVGSFTKPIKSKMGYHIIKVLDTRPARGEVEIGHILIKTKVKGQERPRAKQFVDTLALRIKNGEPFEDVARQFSEDNKTKDLGGYLGYMGINQYEPVFEDAAFALEQDGQVTGPILSKVGYHLIKRISRRTVGSDEKAKKRIQSRISKNDRQGIAENQLLEAVKKEANFSENRHLLDDFVATLDDGFFSYKWEPRTDYIKKGALFNVADRYYNVDDFADFCKKSVRSRLKYAKIKELPETADILLDAFIRQEILAYEEANLEEKYPDFKALMREYREGILLFEITKNEVWDKASQDTVGLEEYFKANRSQYMWPERLQVKKISFDSPETEKLYKFAKKKGWEKFIEKYAGDSQHNIIATDDVLNENIFKGDLRKLKAGQLSELNKSNGTYFYAFKSVIPSGTKTLDEARGYVIADYQDKLEKEWVESLKKDFPIEVESKTLKSLIRG